MSTPDKLSALAALKARRQQASTIAGEPNAAGTSGSPATGTAAAGINSAAAPAAVAASTPAPATAVAAAGPGPRSSAPTLTAGGPHARAPSSSSSTRTSAAASAIPSGSSGLGSSAASRAAGGATGGSSSGRLSSSSTPPPPPPPGDEADDEPLPMRTVEAFAWVCGVCERECVPVRSESRCLCGHRLREHGPASTAAASRCRSAKCGCVGFFYVVAEGSWVLRCRCKHKHTEHNAAHPARGCAKPGCGCGSFDSPWVCNCDHSWAAHRQIVTNKQVVAVRDLLGGLSLAEAPGAAGGGGGSGGGPAAEVNNYDGLKRGQLGPEAFGHM